MAKTTQSYENMELNGTHRQFPSTPNRVLGFGGFAVVLLGSLLIAPGAQSPEVVDPKSTTAATDRAADALQAIEHPRIDPAQQEQRALADFIAKRFRVARDAVGGFVAEAFRAGTEHRVDPLLILAVMAVESRFNPVAESAHGAKGLMQVLPKYHQDKLAAHGGDAALLDPVLNIEIGTRILREYLHRAGGTQPGLQMYVGAFDEPSSQYAGKVLSERARLAQLLARLRRSDA